MATARILRTLLVGLSVCTVLQAGAAAAAQDTPAWGSRIRVTVVDPGKGSTKRLTGTVVASGDTTLTVQTNKSKPPLVIPRANIAGLETSVQPSRKGRGALIGLGVGAFMGAMMGFASGDDPDGLISFTAEAKAGMGAIVLGPLGAIIGALAAPGERWEAVPTDWVRLGFGRSPGGESGIFLTARF